MGRIAAQTFRQVLNQRIREAERERKFEEYANREGDIVTGIIQQTDSRYTLLDLGKVEALLPQAEQVPFERPEPGARLKAYIVEVRRTPKGPQIVVSRTHPGLIKRLFELEVPEIADGIVEIKACAREPGHRTKIAVWSNDHNVDPVGACVGARGARVRMVVTELRGEKIDIVPFSEDQADFVAKALSPAKVKEVRIHEDTGVAEVIVPDFQLSLAIGKEGQNARLAARLTGWRVDIKSETQLAEEEAGIFRSDERYEREEGVEYAEGEWVPNADSGRAGVARGRRHGRQRRGVGRRRRPTPRPTEGEVEACPTDATAEEAAGATEEAAEEALAEEVAIEADLDPIQDAADAEAADRIPERGWRRGRRERRGAGRRRLIGAARRSARASAAAGGRPNRSWCGWHWRLTAASWSVVRLPGGAPGSAPGPSRAWTER